MHQWKICGISLSGQKHQKLGKKTQDKIYWKKSNNLFGIALADGAGSYEHSEIGAEIVTSGSVEYVLKHFDLLIHKSEKEIAKELMVYLHGVLQDKAAELNIHISNLSSTLLFTVIKSGNCLMGHIGDGVIGRIECGMLEVPSPPENGEYINSTYFVTDRNAEMHLRIQKLDISNTNGIFLMSDGTSESLYNRREKKFAAAISTIVGWVKEGDPETAEKLLQENFTKHIMSRTEDDCSFIIMLRLKYRINDLLLKSNEELMTILQTKRQKTIDRIISIIRLVVTGISAAKAISEKTGIPKRAVNRYLRRVKDAGVILK